MFGDGSQKNHRLVAVVGEITCLFSRVIGSGRIGVAADFTDLLLIVDPVGAERQGISDE